MFRWDAVPLAAGDVFDVRVCAGATCQPAFGKTHTRDTSWSWCPDGDRGIYRWQVVVLDGASKAERGARSPVGEIVWAGGACAGGRGAGGARRDEGSAPDAAGKASDRGTTPTGIP